jgi:hypothetical protein
MSIYVGLDWLGANEFVVLCMAANPEPDHAIGSVYTERPKVQPHTGRPKPADPLEVLGNGGADCS